MKKLILTSILTGLFGMSALADTFTWVVPANTGTNILPGPVKITQLVVTTTNTTTVSFYDAPGVQLTNMVAPYTNYTFYATNVSQIYTDFFAKPTTNWLTNALVKITNSSPILTNNYSQIFSQQFASNTTTTVPNMGVTFMNGVLMTNQPYAVTVTATWTGN